MHAKLPSLFVKSILSAVVFLSLVMGLVIPAQNAHAAALTTYVRPGGDNALCNGTVDVDHNVSIEPACAVKTIQKGIDLVDDAGTVNVAAGTYIEELTIKKAITLLGPNSTINPNTGARVSEAVLHPATSGPDPSGKCTVMANLSASNITIKGFTFDGDNPNLTSGIQIGSADVDACEIILGDGTLGANFGDITVENNVLKNSTYTGIDFSNYTNAPKATSNNYIRYNRFENMGETAHYNWGIGVVVSFNFYAAITDNVITGVRTGIQTGNFYVANPGTTSSISNNQIGVWRLGIFHNATWGAASPFTLATNTITAENYPGADKWNGILLSGIENSVTATVSGNEINIPSAVSDIRTPTTGYNVWDVPTSAPITISGGSVTGGKYGVWINNFEGYATNARNTSIIVDGVRISGASTAGINVWDSPLNTNNATVKATLKNNVITTSALGVQISGSDATSDGTCNQISGNTAGLNNTTGTLLTFEKNWWGSASGPSGSGLGTGDSVSPNVDYTPWNVDATCTTFAPPFATQTTMTAAMPNPSMPGQTVSVSATVAGLPTGALTPTGTVTVFEGEATPAIAANAPGTYCTITLVNGTGSCDLTFRGLAIRQSLASITLQTQQTSYPAVERPAIRSGPPSSCLSSYSNIEQITGFTANPKKTCQATQNCLTCLLSIHRR
ncbi:MAG: hypothetical protein PHQ40_21770 [Anaerolineaceae bacterium]|nr:hypothetical protein [Anaerolineaceae bacterium]